MLTFTLRGRVDGILAFEAALARALAAAGEISESAADTIVRHCDATLFDLAAVEPDAVAAGNIAIPIVEQLRTLVDRVDPGAATYVHWGATSQDAIDSALVLQLRDAFASFETHVARLIAILAELATTHAGTPMAGRTLLQHAVPTTFGFKAATWLDAMLRNRVRLASAREWVCTLQFGGAVGTLAVLGDSGPRVAELLAEHLQLERPAIAWHTTRDRMADVSSALAIVAGSLGKIGRDVSLMAQSEIDEVREGAAPGRGRSSTMPHKRNPVACAALIAAAVRAPHLAATMLSAMVQDHERALGAWQAEWDTLPELCRLVDSALAQAVELLANLEIDSDHMAKNLEATRGLVFAEAVSFALARKIGKVASKPILERVLEQHTRGLHLKAALLGDPDATRHLTNDEIDELFDVRRQITNAESTANAVAALADPRHSSGER